MNLSVPVLSSFCQKPHDISTINPSIENTYKLFTALDTGSFEGRLISALIFLSYVDLISVYCYQCHYTTDTKMINFDCETFEFLSSKQAPEFNFQ